MGEFRTTLQVSKSKENPDVFIFTITTPALRTQFKLPRAGVNQLRVDLEKLLKKRPPDSEN